MNTERVNRRKTLKSILSMGLNEGVNRKKSRKSILSVALNIRYVPGPWGEGHLEPGTFSITHIRG